MNLMGFNTFWQSAIKGLIVFSAILVSALAARRPVDAVRRIAEARRSRGRP
jgi:ribose/xylose/arabinose/galactoside ABC-type transport system permease subunit